jgi:hypothetical protein
MNEEKNDEKNEKTEENIKLKLKMKFIYDSLENGFTVRKLEHNKYELINNGNVKETPNDIESTRRSISTPIITTKKFT